MKKLSLLFLLLSLFHATDLSALRVKKSTKKQTISKYLKLQKKFSKKFCSRSEDHKYQKLFKTYKQQKYSVPVIDDVVLDVETVKNLLPEFDKKIIWIKNEINKLLARGGVGYYRHATGMLRSTINDLLVVKEHYSKAESRGLRQKYMSQSKVLMIDLKNAFDKTLRQIPFLLNYSFPVNHLEMRRKYDLYKTKKSKNDQIIKNTTFLKRKLVEDGTQAKNGKESDHYLRALLNSLALSIREGSAILTENQRYDLESVIKQLDFSLRRGVKQHLARMKDWLQRTRIAKKFYQELLASAPVKSPKHEQTVKMLQQLASAKYSLKDYVLKQQAAVYKFWLSQSETDRALFVLETILINEVGGYREKGDYETKDVIRVVLNRELLDRYRILSNRDSIYKYLAPLGNTKINGERWLNLLFREGEFSFTYFYIPATVHIFCPDMSRLRRKLRKRNLGLAFDQLVTPRTDFVATRYFSRVSMLGGIDMASLWLDYRPIAEQPGSMLKLSRKQLRAYKNKKYTYLYSFFHNSVRMDVIEIRNIVMVVGSSKKRQHFYRYRNPHYFRYFRKQ